MRIEMASTRNMETAEMKLGQQQDAAVLKRLREQINRSAGQHIRQWKARWLK